MNSTTTTHQTTVIKTSGGRNIQGTTYGYRGYEVYTVNHVATGRTMAYTNLPCSSGVDHGSLRAALDAVDAYVDAQQVPQREVPVGGHKRALGYTTPQGPAFNSASLLQTLDKAHHKLVQRLSQTAKGGKRRASVNAKIDRLEAAMAWLEDRLVDCVDTDGMDALDIMAAQDDARMRKETDWYNATH